ncbi:MAG: proton-translocating NADH-quinone oxidoreductase, chain [Actinomycetia bacterium]|jgi:NADH-quinone oxidoreductase subunit M|nr:proton-translocating NADH-quinone oxidoreductase, chain [Actinomycetes bacterium]
MSPLMGALTTAVEPTSKLGFPLLTFLVFLPAIGAIVTLLMPVRRPELSRAVGYITSMATLGMALFLLTQFDTNPLNSGFQLLETHSWISQLGVRWTLGVDGISLFMVALSALLFPIGILASAEVEKPKQFLVWMLLLESAMIGVFLALDAMVFFFFFEFVLVPMYFLIAGWGHDNRRYAAMKFFLFTMTGSAFLFAGIVSVAFMHQHATHVLTFDVGTLTNWAAANIHGGTAKVLFLAFVVGFAVKVPLFPFHTWLPDAHTDAPTAGSVVLAGVMLKIGAYGFLRFAIPFFPQAAVDLAPLLIVLAVIGITYGAIVAAMQPNLKRIVAYSSVAHLGFVVLGVFALTNQGISGGLFTMLSHGLTTGALFLLVGMLYDRRHTYELSRFRGIWKAAPVFGGLFVAATFASIGLPGFSGFVGEFLSLLGAFLTSRWYVVVASTGVILAAVYLLWAVQRAFTGEPDDENRATPDINFRELVTVVPLLGLSLFLGFYPKPVLDRLQPSVNALIRHVEANSNYKAPTVPTVVAPQKGEGK